MIEEPQVIIQSSRCCLSIFTGIHPPLTDDSYPGRAWDGPERPLPVSSALAVASLADRQTWAPRTSSISIHSPVGRRQDDKIKFQMFEGRKVPKKVITESSVSQALSISKLCHRPTDSRPQTDTQKNLSLPQGAALGCFVLGALNQMLWAWGVRASLPFYSSQGLKVTLCSLQRFSLSQFCGHLVKLGLIKIQPQISSP